ncbi:MAG: NHL repeat-containing protein [Pseudomonadota bacterium]
MNPLKTLGMAVVAGSLAGQVLCGPAGAVESGPVKLLVSLYGEQDTGVFGFPSGLSLGQCLTLADTNNGRLLFFSADGDKFKYQGKFDAGGKLTNPFCVAELAEGKYLVAERGKRTLTLCDVAGQTATPVVLEGMPRADRFAVGRFCKGPDDRVYLIDAAQKRIVVLSPELRYEREFTVSASGFTGFSDVRVDRRGNVCALETLRGLVHVFDGGQKLLRSFGSRGGESAAFDFPVSLAIDRQGNIYVLDSHRAQVSVFDLEGHLMWRMGAYGWKEGSFNGPAYVAVDDANRVFVVDRLNNRIEVFVPQRPM